MSTVGGMGWGAGGVVEGTAEANDAKIALINAVLTQDGAGAANEGESEALRLWRCGTLRSTEPGAAMVLRRATGVPGGRQVERCVLRACLQSPLTHPLCLSSCEQHDAFLAAAAVVTAAEAEQRGFACRRRCPPSATRPQCALRCTAH